MPFVVQILQSPLCTDRHRLLFARSLAGVYRTNLGGGILDCNDACSRILGYGSRQEQLSQTESVLQLRSDDAQEFLDALKARRFLNSFERSLRRKDNSEVWVLENAT